MARNENRYLELQGEHVSTFRPNTLTSLAQLTKGESWNQVEQIKKIVELTSRKCNIFFLSIDGFLSTFLPTFFTDSFYRLFYRRF